MLSKITVMWRKVYVWMLQVYYVRTIVTYLRIQHSSLWRQIGHRFSTTINIRRRSLSVSGLQSTTAATASHLPRHHIHLRPLLPRSAIASSSVVHHFEAFFSVSPLLLRRRPTRLLALRRRRHRRCRSTTVRKRAASGSSRWERRPAAAACRQRRAASGAPARSRRASPLATRTTRFSWVTADRGVETATTISSRSSSRSSSSSSRRLRRRISTHHLLLPTARDRVDSDTRALSAANTMRHRRTCHVINKPIAVSTVNRRATVHTAARYRTATSPFCCNWT